MPEHGFSDFTPVGFGSSGTPLHRNTPTVLNAAVLYAQFWDGRLATVEDQIPEVFHRTGEAAIDMEQALQLLNASPEYQSLFQKAFGGPPTSQTFCQAIGSYERTLLSGDTRFDRFVFGGDQNALTAAEKKAYEIFTGKGNCVTCHKISQHSSDNSAYALFTDQKFHNLGIGVYGRFMKDSGRYGVTGDRKDFGAFRTAPLRNVALTDPYMHDGSIATLAQVVDLYDRGGIPNSNLDPRIKPLHLSPQEKRCLVAFLKTLSDEKIAKTWISAAKLQAALERENKTLNK
jgi:cytochrome c peroxidase